MITTTILKLVSLLIGVVDSIIPNIAWPSFLSGSSLIPSGWTTAVGNQLHPLITFMPIDTILGVVHDFMLFWPSVAGYLVFEWLWVHVPIIAGFGTH